MDEVRLDCPVACLGLSAYAWGALRRLSQQGDSPCTVGELLDLTLTGRLGELQGIGPFRVTHIEDALLRAGVLVGHNHHVNDKDRVLRHNDR